MKVAALAASLERGIRLTEAAIQAEQERHGTQPDDGTELGRLMAEQIEWVQRERADLEELRSVAGSFYDPSE